ncbi:hypothetical protein FQR65_LT13012 [Abscondita terminalis]|nr:hypothetical protein FQR65_LT13012 [Abscondita terminalis]
MELPVVKEDVAKPTEYEDFLNLVGREWTEEAYQHTTPKMENLHKSNPEQDLVIKKDAVTEVVGSIDQNWCKTNRLRPNVNRTQAVTVALKKEDAEKLLQTADIRIGYTRYVGGYGPNRLECKPGHDKKNCEEEDLRCVVYNENGHMVRDRNCTVFKNTPSDAKKRARAKRNVGKGTFTETIEDTDEQQEALLDLPLKLETLIALLDGIAVTLGSLQNLEFSKCSYLFYIAEFLNGNVLCFLLCFLNEIKKRIQLIHSVIENSHQFRIPLLFLVPVFKIFVKLKDLARETNVVFSVFVCYKLFVCWTFTLIAVFWISSDRYSGQAMTMGLYVTTVFWVFANTTDIIVILYHFVVLENEAKKTVEIMVDLERAVGKFNLPFKLVELFSLQVYVEDFKLSVFGCVLLDWTLLHSVSDVIIE